MTTRCLAAALLAAAALCPPTAAAAIGEPEIAAAVEAVVAAHGDDARPRAAVGVRQVAERWWPEDGDAAAFRAFCVERFIADEAALAATFDRVEAVMEQIDGHLHEVRRELTAPLELDTGPVMDVDRLLATLDLADHVDTDLFRAKVAFLVLLNYPVHDLATRLREGGAWDRETWARSRMTDRFALRVPSEVAQRVTEAFTAASAYIDSYNVRMDRLVDDDGRRPFPEGLRLITHWGLRDELKSQYGREGGLARQRMIQRVMERIVRQEIPADVIDEGGLLWNPATNAVWDAGADPAAAEPRTLPREDDERYRRLLDVFHAVRRVDPYAPTAPTYVQRRFELDRQIPVDEVVRLFETVLGSDELAAVTDLVRERLGRPLEPFDIWYDGFTGGAVAESELDAITRRRYPTPAAFEADLPRILVDLGFAPERAGWIAERVAVDPSRGAGHAMGAQRRQDRAHLRTRVGADGMDYKGYNIAVHEFGHNVEQVLSLHAIDHWFLNGVPNNAFTEALAFVFQERDLELLGLAARDDRARALSTLDTLWGTAEIAGVALVDIAVWQWMQSHPDATPAQLREATLSIATDVWNRWFAPRFGVRDSDILAIYSHMVAYGLYLPDYPLGHLIAFQVASRLDTADDFGADFERMCREGRLTPDAWMRAAVGHPLDATPLLETSEKARAALQN